MGKLILNIGSRVLQISIRRPFAFAGLMFYFYSCYVISSYVLNTIVLGLQVAYVHLRVYMLVPKYQRFRIPQQKSKGSIMVGNNNNTTGNAKLEDYTVGESLVDLANFAGKASWWGLNAIGSASKVARVSIANSKIKAIRVIDDLGYTDVGIHGSNSGYNTIEAVSNLFSSATTKPGTTSGYGNLGKK